MARVTGNREGTSLRSGFAPAVDIFEEKDAIFVKAELPGIKADDIHINVENDVLTLHGERKLEREDTRDGYHRIERSYGTFTRSFALPKTVDADRVEAEMADGVLTLRIPKKAAAEPRRVSVKTANNGDLRQAAKPGKPS